MDLPRNIAFPLLHYTRSLRALQDIANRSWRYVKLSWPAFRRWIPHLHANRASNRSARMKQNSSCPISLISFHGFHAFHEWGGWWNEWNETRPLTPGPLSPGGERGEMCLPQIHRHRLHLRVIREGILAQLATDAGHLEAAERGG